MQLPQPYVTQERSPRELESMVLLASALLGGALALVFWKERRAEARRRVHQVSGRLLRQVFPHGLPR